jgi:hypothetical protein
MDYLTWAPTAEYAVSSAVSGPEAEHAPRPTNASMARRRRIIRRWCPSPPLQVLAAALPSVYTN